MASSCTRKTNRRTAIEDLLKVEVLNGKDSHWVSGWSDADTLFIAIPSYACDDSLKVGAERLKVCDPARGNETVAFVRPDGIYQVKGRRRFVLKILKSASVATVYIDTESGSDAYINQDKSNREGCDLLVIDERGNVSYRCEGFGCTIKGRGNTTWRMAKKPYLLKLPRKSDFLGMRPAKKWVFLANAADETNLRNKIVYDFARRLDFGFVPDSRFADVFLNGRYNGLYLITEKVECKENRLHVPDCDSLFLFQQTLREKGEGLPNCFVTENGQWITLEYPEEYSEQSFASAQLAVRNMESLIMEGPDAEFEQHFDIHSWACKFLIDDIFENTDCNFLSSYFYIVYRGGNVKYYAGPIWDYDRSIGNSGFNYEPDMFLARRLWKRTDVYIPYYGKLNDKPVFFDELCKIYKDDIRPMLDSLVCSGGVLSLAGEIKEASSINQKCCFRNIERPMKTPQDLVVHLTQRMDLLDKIYGERIQVVLVSYERIGRKFYCYKTIPKGEKLDRTMLVGAEQNPDVEWALKGTDQPFDFSRELTEDIVLDILEK